MRSGAYRALPITTRGGEGRGGTPGRGKEEKGKGGKGREEGREGRKGRGVRDGKGEGEN